MKYIQVAQVTHARDPVGVVQVLRKALGLQCQSYKVLHDWIVAPGNRDVHSLHSQSICPKHNIFGQGRKRPS